MRSSGRLGADREGHQQIDDDAERDGPDDEPPAHVAVRVGDLCAAVGDGREPLKARIDSDRRHEPCGCPKSSPVPRTRCPLAQRTRCAEQRDAAHIEHGHDEENSPTDRGAPMRFTRLGEGDQPDTEIGTRMLSGSPPNARSV